jgi:hypothetical protein
MTEFRRIMRLTGAFLATVALSGLLISASAPMARADNDHAKCQHRIEKAQHRLEDAIRRHGEHSPEAESRRHDLNAEREHCWSVYHGYWNTEDNRWHDQHDWEDHH